MARKKSRAVRILGALLLSGLLPGCREVVSTRCFTSCEHSSGPLPDMQAMLGWNLEGRPWRAQLDSSRKALDILKKAMHDSYDYRIPVQSWTGYRDTTWIRVEHGAVLERRFAAWGYREDTSARIERLESYAERGAEVGRSPRGAKPRPLDSLYAECGRHLDSAGAKDQVHFGLDSNYVLKQCGYVPYGCMDDCFRGFNVDVLDWGD